MKRAIFLAGGAVAVFCSYAIALAVGESAPGPAHVVAIGFPGAVAGLVMIAYSAWEARNVRTARGEADELSAQLARKEIEIGRLSTVDELTGLATRREFEEGVRAELERARRHGRELAMLVLEIDDIEGLGESFGRLGKGYLVSEVAGVLRGVLRVNDVGCRYTADRLAMLLPETNETQALAVAARVRAAVDGHSFLHAVQNGDLRITVSQGIAVAGGWVRSHVDLFRAAEQALVDARTAGLNRVHVYAPPDEPSLDAESLPLAG